MNVGDRIPDAPGNHEDTRGHGNGDHAPQPRIHGLLKIEWWGGGGGGHNLFTPSTPPNPTTTTFGHAMTQVLDTRISSCTAISEGQARLSAQTCHGERSCAPRAAPRTPWAPTQVGTYPLGIQLRHSGGRYLGVYIPRGLGT